MIIRRTFSRLLLMVLGACGLAGCDSTSDPQPSPEYACPYADYLLQGTVIDADSSKAIEGIKIRFNDLTAYSDSSGTWRISGRVGCSWRDSLYATDVDGNVQRGTFLPDSLLLNLTRNDPPWPHDEWNLGSFEQTGIVITLEKTP